MPLFVEVYHFLAFDVKLCIVKLGNGGLLTPPAPFCLISRWIIDSSKRLLRHELCCLLLFQSDAAWNIRMKV